MNKKGFLARDWVIAVVLFGGLIALSVAAVADLTSTYDVANVTSPEFQENFDQFSENTEIVQDMFNKTSGGEGLSTVGTFENIFGATFGVIRLVFTSLTSFGTQAFSFIEFFGIPSEVGGIFFTMLLAALTVVIVFAVISAINRKDL